MNIIWFRIVCASRPRGSRRNTFTNQFDLYVTKVLLPSNGDTSKPLRIFYSPNKAEAQKFGKFTAERISTSLNGKGWGLRTKVEPIE